jgi:2-polyprenyl-3-methyl-5-hydroxy-6-metoxy-1,4-benzoquinol methylase
MPVSDMSLMNNHSASTPAPIPPILDRILVRLEAADPIYGQKMRRRLSAMDDHYLQNCANYYSRYDSALKLEGKSIDFAIDCYLKLSDDMTVERANFVRTGKYANSSYKDVEQRIYANPAIMEYHMHGLALAQYLWPDQYERLEFFRKNLPAFTAGCHSYLEVGGGHGLYVLTALAILPEHSRLDLLDISSSSIRLAQQIIGPSRVNYILKDIFEYESPQPCDFITAGEIIEHLEDPMAFLKKISGLLSPDGTIYLTTPVNAPMIDHIYLFKNVQEIRQLITSAGLKIVSEKVVASRDLPEHLIVQHKLPVMYAAFLRKT